MTINSSVPHEQPTGIPGVAVEPNARHVGGASGRAESAAGVPSQPETEPMDVDGAAAAGAPARPGPERPGEEASDSGEEEEEEEEGDDAEEAVPLQAS